MLLCFLKAIAPVLSKIILCSPKVIPIIGVKCKRKLYICLPWRFMWKRNPVTGFDHFCQFSPNCEFWHNNVKISLWVPWTEKNNISQPRQISDDASCGGGGCAMAAWAVLAALSTTATSACAGGDELWRTSGIVFRGLWKRQLQDSQHPVIDEV
jgi:hypothetical protein